MCVAIPVQVVELLPDDMLRGRVGNGTTELRLSSLLLPEPVAVGDYVVVHAGFAMHRIDPAEAEGTLALFRSLTGQPDAPARSLADRKSENL